MNCKMRAFYILFFILAFSLPGFTQINSLSVQNLSAVNVDELSDSEIKTYWQKAAENGLSEENIYRILQEKGLPQTEINKLAARIEKISTEKNTTPSIAEKITGKKDTPEKVV